MSCQPRRQGVLFLGGIVVEVGYVQHHVQLQTVASE
jgi:hypothetical protein